MATILKETVVEKISSLNAAAEPNELVRKQEFDAALAGKPDSADVDAAIDAVAHDEVTKQDTTSVIITLNDQEISADVVVADSLEVTEDGVGAKFGTTAGTVAEGDHTHANDHPAATVNSGNQSIALTIGSDQVVAAEVRLPESGSGLEITADGLKVDTETISPVGHTHDNATTSTPGFMSAADKTKLDGLTGATVTVDDTPTVDLSKSAGGVITADVKPGIGLKEGADALEVDFDEVAAKEHEHEVVTSELPGFMSSAQLAMLEDHEERIEQAEADILTRADAAATQAALDARSLVGHTHEIEDVEGLQDALDDRSLTTHTHPVATEEEAGFMSPDDRQIIDAIPETLTRDLARFDLCDCGGFDGEVRVIAISGGDVYIGGAFTRYGNVDSPGLAKLDHRGDYDPFFQMGEGFTEAINFLRASEDGVVAASIEDGSFRASVAELPVWKVNADGTRDTAFTSPATIAALGADQIASVAILTSGKIAVLTPQTLTVLNTDGSVFFQATGSARFNAIREFGNQLLLTSHAFSSEGVGQTYDNITNPKGAKLLNFGADSAVKIAFVADFGTNTSPAADVAAATKRYAPDHWVFGGDNNYDVGSAFEIDDNWGQHYRAVMGGFIGSGVAFICTKAGSVGALKRVNLWDGEIVDIGNTLEGVTNVVLIDLAEHPSTGVLYGISETALYSVNKITAALTKIADVTPDITGLAFSQDGVLYGSADRLYTINTTTGVPTAVGDAWDSFQPQTDLAFDSNGELYLSMGGSLWTVSADTGVAEEIKESAYTNLDGLAHFNGKLYAISNSGAEGTNVRLITIDPVNVDAEEIADLTDGYAIKGLSYCLPPLKTDEVDATGVTYDAVIGNHDAGNVVGAGYDYEPHLRYSPNAIGNKRYYKRTIGDADCFYLNSDKNEPDGYSDTSDQHAWFVEQIQASTARWKFVFLHHAPRSSESGYTSNWMDDWDFEGLGVDAVFAGHAHVAEHVAGTTCHYFTCGIGGKSLRSFGTPVSGSVAGSRYSGDYGFLGIEVTYTETKVRLFNRLDAEIYSFTMSKASEGSTGEAAGRIDPIWALNTNGGTGALASCGEAIVSPDRRYFIIGNDCGGYHNSIDTSWNAEMLGNLLSYSEQFDNAAWVKVGTAPVVTANTDDNPDGVQTADTISDNGGMELAYIYQDVAIEDDSARYDFALYVKKDTDETRFPVMQVKLTGGTEVSAFAHINTETGAVQISGSSGGGSPAVASEDAGDFWRVTLSMSNTSTGNETLRAMFYPSYSPIFGGAAVVITGEAVIWGAQVRLDWWSDGYTPTVADPVEPSNSETNADRFRGLYKIRSTGKEDATFNCNIAINATGHVIPFAIDGYERIYFGGPVSSIDGIAVTPWRLYRITKEGAFDKEYAHFNDQVLCAALTSCGELVVGGKFTAYGSKKVGRIIRLNPDGTVASDESKSIPITGTEEPDVIENPCDADRLWIDTRQNPAVLREYDRVLEEWRSICDICAIRTGEGLPMPVFDPPTGNAPIIVSISVPGYPNAQIYYTLDGSDPDPEDQSQLYTGPFSITAETTARAIAVQSGLQDSEIAVAYYYDSSYQQVDPVTFVPPSGTIIPTGGSLDVELLCATDGATIYYTLDGSEPTEASAEYSAPINITDPTTIRARAFKGGYSPSNITSASYIDSTGTKVLGIDWAQVSDADKTGAAVVGEAGDFWNKASTSGASLSDLKYADETESGIDLAMTAAPTGFHYIASGNGTGDQMVSIAVQLSHTSSGGKHPFAFSLRNMPVGRFDLYLYSSSGAFTVTRRGESGSESYGTHICGGPGDAPPWVVSEDHVKFEAIEITEEGQWLEIAVAANGHIAGLQLVEYAATLPELPLVVFSPPSGSPAGSSVTLSLPEIEAPFTIFYTDDGTDPTESSDAYSAPIPTSGPTIIKAFARKTGYQDSEIAAASYGSGGGGGAYRLPPIEIYGVSGGGSATQLGPNAFLIRWTPAVTFGLLCRVTVERWNFTLSSPTRIHVSGAHPFRDGHAVRISNTNSADDVFFVRDYTSTTGDFSLARSLNGSAVNIENLPWEHDFKLFFHEVAGIQFAIYSAAGSPQSVTYTSAFVQAPSGSTDVSIVVRASATGYQSIFQGATVAKRPN